MMRGPGLRDQRGARGPLAPHAQSQQHPEEHQLRGRLSKSAQRRGQGINQHADGKRPNPSVAIGKPAKTHASDRCGHERGRHHRSA